MRFIRAIFLLFLTVVLVGSCLPEPSRPPIPQTLAVTEPAISYGYYPLDPLPVGYWNEEKTKWLERDLSSEHILGLLPDETMRIAIGQVSAGGNISYGPAKVGKVGNSYVVILDYIKFTTDYIDIDLIDFRAADKAETVKPAKVPVYIGIGLRLTANVTVNEGSVDLGNLLVLGASAQAKQVSGTMVVQTLGISGETVSPIIPIPSEINPTTMQNSLMSIGTIKAKIYDKGTKVKPRVVGVYNNLGGGQGTINVFLSKLVERVALRVPNYIVEAEEKEAREREAKQKQAEEKEARCKEAQAKQK